MAVVKYGNGFEITDYTPIDVRQVLTKAEMATIVGDDDSSVTPGDFAMPEVYFAFCTDDGCFYKFDYNATPDPETGKFTKLELGGNVPEVEASDTAPANPEVGDKWLDTSTTPPTEKEWDGTQWTAATPASGEMIYDATNDKILYFDGTEWKELAGGITKETSVDTSQPGEAGDVVYDETTKEFKIYEPAASGESDGVWLNMAKVWEGTEAQYTALGGDTWSRNHKDVIIFISD